MPSRMSHDVAEAATAPSSEVHSEADAIKWMVEGIYLVEGKSVTAKKLSHIMLQIAASIPKLTKQGANAFRAAAFILEGLTVEQEGKAIGDAVGAHFGAALKEQLKMVKETTTEMAKHGEAMVTAADAVREMLAERKAQGTDDTTENDTQLADAVGNVLARTEEAVRILKEEKEQRATQMTYAAKIHRAINKMQPYKGTRAGTWPNVVFQKTADDIVPHLTPIFRAVFELETYHEDWATMGTLAHRKPGKADYTIPGAWRPIVLSSPYGHLLNSCVRDQVSTMTERKGILPSHHFGGRPGRNTTDALHLLLKVVWDAWRRGKVASVLSLDVKGAFTSTDVERLQHNMRTRRVPKEIVDYMGRRLACRKTQLIFDDFVSEEFVVDAGLDQGDPFSPTAYLLYNSDHLSIADPRNGEHVFVFIDDTTIVTVGASFEETHEKLESLMERERAEYSLGRRSITAHSVLTSSNF